MSSVFLYIGIVAIWAFVLIPRWLRRPQTVSQQVAEPEESAGDYADDDSPSTDRKRGRRRRRTRAPLTRSKVLQARRRLLTMLIALSAVAGACTYFKLTKWWACVPPGAMLCFYVLLLRAAARADAERARWWAAEYERQQETLQRAEAEQAERTAEVIDISARLTDQLYDQYADATIRAVGD